MKRIKEIQSLKEKMSALRAGDFDVEADNPKVVKCWERLGCKKEECPAYGRLRCWSIAGTSCHGEVQGEFAQKLGDCRKCVVYRESCGDEISEFVEVFNQMVKDIKFNLSEQEKTEKKRAEDERLAELGNMVAVVAHETRNPLHSIGLAASYLKKNFHGELVTEFLNIIEAEVKKLDTLTTIFLSFSNPAPLTITACDLNAIVHTAVEDFRSGIPKRKNRVRFELEEKIPPVPCDAMRISEAVRNLLDNAATADTANTEITIRTARNNNRIMISVQDNGPGIAPGHEKDIFAPFYTSGIHGPGLGLAIVERTAKEHNGTVTVNSQAGRGATFTITLPIVEHDTPGR